MLCLKKILGQKGFSMVQGLAVAAALGGVSLMLMQQNKISSQQSRAASTNLAVLELQGQIQNYLLLESSCTASLRGPVLQNDGNSGTVAAIKNESGIDVFTSGGIYVNDQVQIQSMVLHRVNASSGLLKVAFNRVGNQKGRGVGGAQVIKDYPVSAQWDPAGNLLKCYSDISNAVDTAVTNVLAGLCKDATAPANGLFFDSGSGFCQTTELAEQVGSNTPLVEPCPANEAITQITYNPDTRQYSRVCAATYSIPPTCEADSLLRRRSDGTFDCVKPVCPGTQIFQGLDGNGTPICIACGAGQVAVSVGGMWKCSKMSCPASQYFLGLDSMGNPICNDLIDTSVCEGAGKLVASAGGKVKFECCVADCSDQGNQCTGTVFNSKNNCGVCNGTKAPDCGNPGDYCEGSYPSANGCGSCTGTKLPKNGVWSDFKGTDEYRVKSGATCSCTTKKIARERKYVRTCSLPECGGTPCSGAAEQWVEEGEEDCTPTVCEEPGACQGSGGANDLFILGAPDTGSCAEKYRYQYLDIQVDKFKVGNIYSITQGWTWTAEVLPGDTPRKVLERLAAKLNAAPATSTGACGTSANQATVVSDTRIKYRVQWQHSTLPRGSYSCNVDNKEQCLTIPGCKWETSAAYVCKGGNYLAKVGTCQGTFYVEGCGWDGYTGSESNQYECQYSYRDAASCNAQWSKGCRWGSIPQTCYGGTEVECKKQSGCSWKAYPDEHRSCTAASWETACKEQGAGVCSWVKRNPNN